MREPEYDHDPELHEKNSSPIMLKKMFELFLNSKLPIHSDLKSDVIICKVLRFPKDETKDKRTAAQISRSYILEQQ
ncbi:hypothetical protein J6590_045728 [Homalodisca vitripennis]|nr:hypothetical protein J6590_045728 [Homalodisca vitripennis]